MKLIVLDRLMSLRGAASHERVLQELVMDILRVLSSPDLEVRKKTLALVLDLVTSRNIEEVSCDWFSLVHLLLCTTAKIPLLLLFRLCWY